ncbi:hypothetical protein [Telluribacter humicola]|uniref:hypothetical protein n=1 Tax=Telluribacter humicola TaxID=1720261 RepID=UPI001A959626|nr:hypothetical protein [Telluribacter humicola]
MKSKLSVALIGILLFSQCSVDRSIAPKVDYEQARIEFLKELVPHITGTWNMRKIQIKRQNSTYHAELKLKNDTILTNFATLTLTLASGQPDPGSSRYEGNIQYGTKKYPIKLDLIAGSWLYNQKGEGSKGYFLIEYNYPPGTSHIIEKEEKYLEQIGLISENFSLETTSGPMIWKGLNRGIEQIDFIKK